MLSATLECGQCGTSRQRPLNDPEVRALSQSGAVRLFCEQCGEATTWIYARRDRRRGRDRRARAREQSELHAQIAPPPRRFDPHTDIARAFLLDASAASGRRARQRRGYPRFPLELAAMVSVRWNGTDFQDAVRTENVSHGGLRFQSERPYYATLAVGVEMGAETIRAGVVPGVAEEQRGVVVRVDPLPATGRRGIAVKLN